MNRRRFLSMFGTGVVATATMAEAGFLTDFMKWIKRNPVWSIPCPGITAAQYADYISMSDLITGTSLSDYYAKKALDEWKYSFPYDRRPLPPRSGNEIVFYRYDLLTDSMESMQ